MTTSAKKVLEDGLDLDLTDRARVAAELIASLDGPADENTEEAWAAEIERRVREIDSGATDLLSWEDVRRGIQNAVQKR